MKTPQQNKKERQRRFLLVMPIIVIPFMTLVFWALGGGQSVKAGKTAAHKGFNSLLPDAHLKGDTAMNKMGYYEKAAKDSSRKQDLIKSDPYYRNDPFPGTANESFGTPYYPGSQPYNSYGSASQGPRDANEAKITQKLEQLNRALQSESMSGNGGEGAYLSRNYEDGDVSRLKKMMESMNTKEADPEMEQLSGMLDKIMDIQNPEREQQRLAELSRKKNGRVYPVAMAKKREMISLMEEKEKANEKDTSRNLANNTNGFYSLDGEPGDSPVEQNAIEASIVETQTIVSGSTVKLRLLDDIYINGQLIPRDNFIFGTASLSGERLNIVISAIRLKKSIFPVDLAVIDIDGIEGIYIPGAIARDVAKASSDRTIQDLSFGTSMSNSVGIQAAGAGLEAAKSFFSKKVKLVKVTVKAGYNVLLQDTKQKQDTN